MSSKWIVIIELYFVGFYSICALLYVMYIVYVSLNSIQSAIERY